ncbi:MAG: cytochrome c3 family protein [Acidobacteriia bacterium]|nr:cytochrome c3 family protein [Terriglobia bacterium]
MSHHSLNSPGQAGLKSFFRSRYFFLGLVVFFIGGMFTLSRWVVSSGPQPIQFNHSKHKEAGLNCTDCHSGALDQAEAGLPQMSVCLGCHEAPLTQSKEEEKIRTLAAAGNELAWIQVTRLPQDVYFSHRRHARLAHLECSVCHGGIGESIRPPVRPAVTFSMSRCLDCHQKMHAYTNCYGCHR